MFHKDFLFLYINVTLKSVHLHVSTINTYHIVIYSLYPYRSHCRSVPLYLSLCNVTLKIGHIQASRVNSNHVSVREQFAQGERYRCHCIDVKLHSSLCPCLIRFVSLSLSLYHPHCRSLTLSLSLSLCNVTVKIGHIQASRVNSNHVSVLEHFAQEERYRCHCIDMKLHSSLCLSFSLCNATVKIGHLQASLNAYLISVLRHFVEGEIHISRC